jgi:tRNA(Ile)-lysidine synthase
MIQEQFLEHLQIIAPKAKRLLLAVSGGSDSIALLRLFYPRDIPQKPEVNSDLFFRLMCLKLQEELGLTLNVESIHVAHFDHALRDNSSKDANFVKELCQTFNIPFHSERVDIGSIAKEKKWNLEDAARRLRYSFLTRLAKRVKADAILTAHTQDDQAETVLMQLLRGAAHLTGMREVQGSVVRPLLKVSKQELLEYLKSINQNFRTDESNFDVIKTRAWLRQELLPALESRYPYIKKTLAQLADLQQDQQLHFESISKKLMRAGIDLAEADVDAILKQDIAVQRQVIHDLMHGMDYQHIEAIRKQLSSDVPVRVSLPRSQLARIAYGKIRVLAPFQQSREPFPAVPRRFEKLDKYWLEQIAETADLEKLKAFENLEFRSRQPGDTIQLSGGTKKVSDLLIDWKIPREERERLPVLASKKNVLWIKNTAVDARVAKPKQDNDFAYMKRALSLAQKATEFGELPVGCIIVKNNEIIAEAHNETETTKDPTAHAEVLAMRRAAEKLGDWRLEGCTLYVTLEPCPMCFGTILQAHVSKVVYGARNPRDGALGSVLDMRDAPWKRKVDIKSGVLAKECAKLLTKFFGEKR